METTRDTDVAGTIAVGYDGRPRSDVAVRWAVRYAAESHRTVTVVHACGLPAGFAGTADGAALTVGHQDLEARGRLVLEKAHAVAHEVDPDVRLLDRLVIDDPRPALAGISAAGPSLLVVGTHGHGQLIAYLAGSVSEGTSAVSACPLVVAREREAPDQHSEFYDKVVIGVAGADSSHAVVDPAFEVAVTLGKSVAVLHLSDSPPRDAEAGDRGTGDSADDVRRRELSASMARHIERYPDVPVSLHLVESHPRWALVDASRHAHLVAVGSRGQGDTAALVHGSLSRYLIEHAHGPVMVARHRND